MLAYRRSICASKMITHNCYRKCKTLNETSSIILVSKKSLKNFNSRRTLRKCTGSQGDGGGGGDMTCQKNKWCTTVLKSETLNLFQNNSVNSLSLLFLSLQFIFSIHPCESAHDSYIPSLFFAYLVQTPDNSNVF